MIYLHHKTALNFNQAVDMIDFHLLMSVQIFCRIKESWKKPIMISQKKH